MTPDNKRAILEAAAKACGIDGIWQEGYGVFIKGNYMLNPGERPKFFNPIDNSLDTSAMCAVLDIDTYWYPKKTLCFVAEMVRGLDTSTMKNTTAPPKERKQRNDSRQRWSRLSLEGIANELPQMWTSEIFGIGGYAGPQCLCDVTVGPIVTVGEVPESFKLNDPLYKDGFQAGAASRDAEIEELLAALKPFGAIDLVESRLPAEFAMLILRARAAIAKVRKP